MSFLLQKRKKKAMQYFAGLLGYYKSSAIILLNTLVLFLLLNIGLSAMHRVEAHFHHGIQSTAVEKKYGDPLLKKVYPELSEQEINDLLTETYRPYIYDPFTQFKEAPRKGKYVNVDENGFRITKNQGPWPPDEHNFNIFLFGGSTTFGYGVADDQTIASHLQEFLSHELRRDVRIYNFGRGYYYSTQESILFQRLLVSGPIPRMAIFIDGLNEFFYRYRRDEPFYTLRLSQYFETERALNVRYESYLLQKLPIAQLTLSLRDYLHTLLVKDNPPKMPHQPQQIDNQDWLFDDGELKVLIDRYVKNKKLIETVATLYGVQPVFVWQPQPYYKYDLSHHLFAQGEGYHLHINASAGYLKMNALFKRQGPSQDFLWCADIQEHLKEPLYVDAVHYSAKMSKIFALAIADSMLKHNFPTVKVAQLTFTSPIVDKRYDLAPADGETLSDDTADGQGARPQISKGDIPANRPNNLAVEK